MALSMVVNSLVQNPEPGDQLTEGIFELGSIGLIKVTQRSPKPILTSNSTVLLALDAILSTSAPIVTG